MSDDRLRIELAGAKEPRHLMPCVVHLPSHHTVDGDSLEDDFLWQVDLDRLRRNAEHLDSASDSNESESLVNRGRHSGHFEHDVNAKSVRRALYSGLGFAGSDDVVRAHLLRER